MWYLSDIKWNLNIGLYIMNELIKKMRYADTWHRYDISVILAKYNSDVGDEIIFKDLMFRAQRNQKLSPIDPPKGGGAFMLNALELKEYNYEYSREQMMHWISKNKWNLPDEFNLDYVHVIDADNEYYSAELHIANITQRWLMANFDKDSPLTSKQQIMDYLNKCWSNQLSNDAKDRIASIVNPDCYKKGGRPRNSI